MFISRMSRASKRKGSPQFPSWLDYTISMSVCPDMILGKDTRSDLRRTAAGTCAWAVKRTVILLPSCKIP
jgi:hypothetical protein